MIADDIIMSINRKYVHEHTVCDIADVISHPSDDVSWVPNFMRSLVDDSRMLQNIVGKAFRLVD